MDLKSGYPYWIVRNGLNFQFPRLERDVECDVAVIGAGITGALIARELAAGGHDVVVLDKRDAAWGSTSASTAMIQYEIDTELVELARLIGTRSAVASYRACEAAIGQLGEIAATVPGSRFEPAASLYLASHRWHAPRLRREADMRRRHGFAVETLEHADVKAAYGLDASLALLTPTAGQVDPYRMARGLLKSLRGKGVRVFDRSEVVERIDGSRFVDLRTSEDVHVRCRHVVVAAGYESQPLLPQRVARNRSSYALVTEPVRDIPDWLRETLIWESSRPYLYVRTTTDGRLLVGGEDDRVDIPLRRDARVASKADTLLKRLRQWLPDLTLEPGFAWAGTFAETKDGLPFFGAHPALDRRVLFAMAYGGNGIIYSVIGAELLRATIERRRHPLRTLFSFARLG
jgi:glycine/D-amino acid oxidase-like deaminating enzyme